MRVSSGTFTSAAPPTAGRAAPATLTRSVRWSWLREPLLQFLVLGALLYGAARLFASDGADTQIVVDAPRVARLVKLYELQTGTQPDRAQRERLVESFVREEMLYREARKQRLDDGDELVRRRLVQKIEFLQAAASGAEPGDDALRAILAAEPGRYAAPATVTLEHRYFSADQVGADAARAAARAALAASQDGVGPVGDRSPLPVRLATQSREDLTLAFGPRPIVDAAFSATPGVWSGPVESGFGWHLIRVSERSAGRSLSFDEARPALLAARQHEQRLRAEAAWLEELRGRYRVVRADRDPPPGPGSNPQ